VFHPWLKSLVNLISAQAHYYQDGKRWWLRLHEKGGKLHERPAHHNAEAYLDASLTAAGIAEERKAPLFRSAAGKTGQLTGLPLDRRNAWNIVKRRAKLAGVSDPSGSATTPSGPPASRPISKAAAPSI
jgi:hypothetical protein